MIDCNICGEHLNNKGGEHVAICITVVNTLGTSIENRSYCAKCYKSRVLPLLQKLNDGARMQMMLEESE